ncbi:C10 family peptidase [Flavobacterium psychrophilum]|uniref:C10 family peptidase n=1 Tax=Flavobacterium psychrophilum TaxID=96345 RepID=UPI001D060A52|nr:C10 family peptidase [Flavobacterium psychrophilum]MCB6062646.1 C10 family peptidase [Flavobacterium psychrophilum]
MYRKRRLNLFKNFILAIAGLFIIFSCENEKINETTTINQHEVTQKIAEKVALNVFRFKNNELAKSAQITKSIENVTTYKMSTTSDVNAFYVFNYNEGGFSIVSADDRVSPVLAYCDEGAFSTNINEIPEPVQSWMEEEKEISQTVKIENSIQTHEIKLDWDSALNKLPPPKDPNWCTDNFYQKGPLLTTTWDQGSTYNNLTPMVCPNSSGGRAPTGCIATAMAQIMKYWHKPNSYNWINMPNSYGTVDTQSLMRDIGNGWINYGCNGSSQQSNNISGRFNNFGYNASFTDNYSASLITQQLSWNRPVIVTGGRKKDGISWNMYTEGHAWVCDGYQQIDIRYMDENNNCQGWGYLYLHMNWGWGGYCNGWYNAHNFNPSTYTFNFKRKIVYNITP